MWSKGTRTGPRAPADRRSTPRIALVGALALGVLLAATSGQAGAGIFSSTRKNGFDLSQATIPIDDIRRGGPPRDGIPSIDDPKFVSVEAADAFLEDDNLVLSLVGEGFARAYPRRILEHHEIVNDIVGGAPLVISYCPLCGTAMVFDRAVRGRVLEFGVSGLLYQSDVLMYDRQTESLWSQIGSAAVSGDLVGTPLHWLPSRMVRWRSWKAEHPEGEVLSRDTGHRRDYSRSAYAAYYSSSRTMFPVDRHRDDLDTKEWVFGLVVDGQAKAYRVAALPDGRALSDVVGGKEIRIRFEQESLSFEAQEADSGEEIPHTLAYWFAWQAFHPETELFGASKRAAD